MSRHPMHEDPMSEPALTLDMVINRCSGGYRLSPAAARALAARKGLELYAPVEGEELLFVRGQDREIERCLRRDDPDLVAVVREMGRAANGHSAELRVVRVPIHVEVEDSDGLEEVTVYGGAFSA